MDTPIGKLQIDYRDGHLFTNFVGSEIKAKVIFGHWKNNSFCGTEKEVEAFLIGMLKTIDKYKTDLKG